MEKCPVVLLIIINRYDEFFNKINEKEQNIYFQQQLNLKNIIDSSSNVDDEHYMYNLVSVINHHRATKDSRHYTASAKIYDIFYKFNDNQVKKIKKLELCNSYMLFFTKHEIISHESLEPIKQNINCVNTTRNVIIKPITKLTDTDNKPLE